MAGFVQEDVSKFRQWLVEALKRTTWTQSHDMTLDQMSELLWVRPEAIVAAQRALNKEAQEAGRLTRQLGMPRSTRPKNHKARHLDIRMPEAVWADFTAVCERQNLTREALIRSLVHHMLSCPENPRNVSRGWYYRGRRHECTGILALHSQGKPWPYRVQTEVTHGAYQALHARALEVGARPTFLVNGALIDLLEGRTLRFAIISNPASMWDDPDRYVTAVKKG